MQNLTSNVVKNTERNVSCQKTMRKGTLMVEIQLVKHPHTLLYHLSKQK